MRIRVNLASEPFRRDRPLVAASIAVGVALTGVLAMLISLAILERGTVAETRQGIARLERQMQQMAQEQGQMEAALRRP